MTNGRLLHVNVSSGRRAQAPGSGPRSRASVWRATGSTPSRCMAVRIVPSRSSASRRSGASRRRDIRLRRGRRAKPHDEELRRLAPAGRDAARRRGRGRPGAGFRGRSVPDDPALVPRPSVQPSRASDASRRQPDVRPGGPGGHRPAGRCDRRGRARRRRSGAAGGRVAPRSPVRSACLSLWRAAADGGGADRDPRRRPRRAACAALPSRAFNQAVGFAHLPNLSGLAVRHFRDHGAIGWVWADDEPWAGRTPTATRSTRPPAHPTS